MDDSEALDGALAHLIAATNLLLSADDPNGECLIAAILCLELQQDLTDLGAVGLTVDDEICPPGLAAIDAAVSALRTAIRLLHQVARPAPKAIADQFAAIAKDVGQP